MCILVSFISWVLACCIVGNVWGDSSGSVSALRERKVGQDGERRETRVTESTWLVFYLSMAPSQIARWLNPTLSNGVRTNKIVRYYFLNTIVLLHWVWDTAHVWEITFVCAFQFTEKLCPKLCSWFKISHYPFWVTLCLGETFAS